jgi:hypothetical protein
MRINIPLYLKTSQDTGEILNEYRILSDKRYFYTSPQLADLLISHTTDMYRENKTC